MVIDLERSRARRRVQEAQHWLSLATVGDLDGDARMHFDRWLASDAEHPAIYERERRFRERLAQEHDVFAAALEEPIVYSWKHRLRDRPMAAVAALLMLFALPMAWLSHGSEGDVTTAQAIKAVDLPDGSRMVLDADTAVDVAFAAHARTVSLKHGRAWFSVVHDSRRPFAVVTDTGVVQDIGTAFEVSVDGDGTHAAVTEGEVTLAAHGATHSPTHLHAGQAMTVDRDGRPGAVASVPVADIAAWRSGDLLLRNATPRQAARLVARYRRGPVWVVGQGGNPHRISGFFRADRPDEALDMIAREANLTRTNLVGGVVILTPGRPKSR